MKNAEHALDKLAALARAEYGLPLTQLIRDDMWYARLTRLTGVLIKEPFAEARAIDPDMTRTGARRQWVLQSGTLVAGRDSWQFQLLDELAQRRGTTADAIAADAQYESGFYSQVANVVASTICTDDGLRSEIKRIDSDLQTKDGRKRVLTSDQRLTRPAKQLESLLTRVLPSLHPDLVVAYTLIIGLAGIDGFCSTAHRQVSEDQIEHEKVAPPSDPGPGGATGYSRVLFACAAVLFLAFAVGLLFILTKWTPAPTSSS
jgi:hypothetical protein